MRCAWFQSFNYDKSQAPARLNTPAQLRLNFIRIFAVYHANHGHANNRVSTIVNNSEVIRANTKAVICFNKFLTKGLRPQRSLFKPFHQVVENA